MLLVVDANVFVGELLRVRGRELIEGSRLQPCVSEEALDEALHELNRRAAKIVAQVRTTRAAMNAALAGALARIIHGHPPWPRKALATVFGRDVPRLGADTPCRASGAPVLLSSPNATSTCPTVAA